MFQAIGLARHDGVAAESEAAQLRVAGRPAALAARPFQLAELEPQRQVLRLGSRLRLGRLFRLFRGLGHRGWPLRQTHAVGLAGDRVARHAKRVANLRNGKALVPQLAQLRETFFRPCVRRIRHAILTVIHRNRAVELI